MSQLTWTGEPEEEYNQYAATTPSGTRLTVFSDRDGEEWGYTVANDDAVFGYSSLAEVQDAAEEAANALGLW